MSEKESFQLNKTLTNNNKYITEEIAPEIKCSNILITSETSLLLR